MAWSLAQSVQSANEGSAGTSIPVTLPSQVTIGDFLVVCGIIQSTTQGATITDNTTGGSNTYTTDLLVNWASTGNRLVIAHCVARATMSSLTVTLASASGSSTLQNVAVGDYTPPGVVTLDGTASGTGASSSASGSNLVQAGTGELAVCYVTTHINATTFTAGTGWTIRNQHDGAGGEDLAFMDNQSASGTLVPAATLSGSATWIIGAVSYGSAAAIVVPWPLFSQPISVI
jgi:hypothetical protein